MGLAIGCLARSLCAVRVYLDHQSSTPVLPEVWEAMRPFLRERFGAAAGLHQEGHAAREALGKAREQFAGLLGAEGAENILFTGGATEAVNLAVKGTAWANQKRGNHIILSAIEHPAVANSVGFLEGHGFTATRVEVDGEGRIDPKAIAEALREETILICIHHANHDLGTIQPVAAVGEIAAERGIPLFVDATASAGWLPVNAREMKAALVAVAPHRFYGPKGVGVLYRNRRARLTSLVHGGDQEEGRRAGTENVPGIAGAGVAAEMAGRELESRAAHTRRLQAPCWEGLAKEVPYIRLNGPAPGAGRMPNNLNVSIEFIEGEGLALALDVKGFAIASGAACVTKSLRVPPALKAIGLDEALAKGNVLVSFGKENTGEEIERFVETAAKTIALLREMSPLWEDFQRGLLDSRISPRKIEAGSTP